jgi:hypothetical protein
MVIGDSSCGATLRMQGCTLAKPQPIFRQGTQEWLKEAADSCKPSNQPMMGVSEQAFCWFDCEFRNRSGKRPRETAEQANHHEPDAALTHGPGSGTVHTDALQ